MNVKEKLAAHVAKCKDFIYIGIKAEYASSQPMPEKRRCGDGGWWCDKAKKILKILEVP